MKIGLNEAVSFDLPSGPLTVSFEMPSMRSFATRSDASAQMSTILL